MSGVGLQVSVFVSVLVGTSAAYQGGVFTDTVLGMLC